MNSRIHTLLVSVILSIPSLLLADGQIVAWGFSPDIHLAHSARLVSDHQAAGLTANNLLPMSFGALPEAADVDALQGLVESEVLFSLDTSVILGETLFRPEDVIRFNGTTWSMQLDGSEAGIPPGVNVDGVAVSDGMVLISLDISAQLGDIHVDDSDIVAWNGIEFSLFFDSSTAGIEIASDVDAIHVDGVGHILISMKGSGKLGEIDYQDEDVLIWNFANWAMFYDGSLDDDAWLAADLDAWSAAIFSESIFFNGFE